MREFKMQDCQTWENGKFGPKLRGGKCVTINCRTKMQGWKINDPNCRDRKCRTCLPLLENVVCVILVL